VKPRRLFRDPLQSGDRVLRSERLTDGRLAFLIERKGHRFSIVKGREAVVVLDSAGCVRLVNKSEGGDGYIVHLDGTSEGDRIYPRSKRIALSCGLPLSFLARLCRSAAYRSHYELSLGDLRRDVRQMLAAGMSESRVRWIARYRTVTTIAHAVWDWTVRAAKSVASVLALWKSPSSPA
jgi:hypothetical protein